MPQPKGVIVISKSDSDATEVGSSLTAVVTAAEAGRTNNASNKLASRAEKKLFHLIFLFTL
jgi:hypothetical protein